MSIVTLKRKTQAQYNNMSVGEHGFSLNGTRRSQGYVGQTMLSRSLPRTTMRGNTLRGHGGCCGHYQTKGVIQSAVTSLNNPNVVKRSCINTLGMIEEKYKPYHNMLTSKPDSTQNSNTVNEFTENLGKAAAVAVDTNKVVNKNLKYSCKKSYNAYFRSMLHLTTSHARKHQPITAESHTDAIAGKILNCATNNQPFVPSPKNGGVLPGPPATY
jgi:hypothetical protein